MLIKGTWFMKCADAVIIMIFSLLEMKDLTTNIPRVCKQYKNLSQNNLVWRHIVIHYLIRNNHLELAQKIDPVIKDPDKNLKGLLQNSFLEQKNKVRKLAIMEEKAKKTEEESLATQMAEFQSLMFANQDPRITEPFPTYPVSYSTSSALQYPTMHGDPDHQARCCITMFTEIFSCCIPSPSYNVREEKESVPDNRAEIFAKGTLEFEIQNVSAPKP